MKEAFKGSSEVSNSSHDVQVSVSYKNRNIKLEQNIPKTVQELKKNFCEAEKLNLSSVRLLLNGQRLDDKDTIESLELSDYDVIEAFFEMSGGGKPKKPKNLVDELEILNALDKSFDYSEQSDTESDTEQQEHGNIPAEKVAEEKDLIREECTETNEEEGHQKKVSEESSLKPIDYSSETIVECSDISDEQFLNDLRQNETFSRKKPLYKKIIHLLELPNISEVEIGILKDYLVMRENLNKFHMTMKPL